MSVFVSIQFTKFVVRDIKFKIVPERRKTSARGCDFDDRFVYQPLAPRKGSATPLDDYAIFEVREPLKVFELVEKLRAAAPFSFPWAFS